MHTRALVILALSHAVSVVSNNAYDALVFCFSPFFQLCCPLLIVGRLVDGSLYPTASLSLPYLLFLVLPLFCPVRLRI